MNDNATSEAILKKLKLNTRQLIKTETQLEGLLWSKPITYWVQTDALLNLQIKNHSSR
jgi:tryptophan 2,3-dioxygenase